MLTTFVSKPSPCPLLATVCPLRLHVGACGDKQCATRSRLGQCHSPSFFVSLSQCFLQAQELELAQRNIGTLRQDLSSETAKLHTAQAASAAADAHAVQLQERLTSAEADAAQLQGQVRKALDQAAEASSSLQQRSEEVAAQRAEKETLEAKLAEEHSALTAAQERL